MFHQPDTATPSIEPHCTVDAKDVGVALSVPPQMDPHPVDNHHVLVPGQPAVDGVLHLSQQLLRCLRLARQKHLAMMKAR